MSADLFAQFGPSGSPSTTSQSTANQKQTQSTPSEDPFAFLATAFPHPKPPPSQSQSTIQPAQPAQRQTWQDFSSFTQPAATQPAATTVTNSSWNVPTTSTAATPPPAAAPIPVSAEDDDDGWGDFEEATPGTTLGTTGTLGTLGTLGAPGIPVTHSGPTLTSPSFTSPTAPSTAPPRTRVTRASTIDLMTNTLVHFGDTPQAASLSVAAPSSIPPNRTNPPPQPWRNTVHQIPEITSPPPVPQPKKPADPNVLFDAEAYHSEDDASDHGEGIDDFDDFGDFETGQPASKPVFSSAPTRAPVFSPTVTTTTSSAFPSVSASVSPSISSPSFPSISAFPSTFSTSSAPPKKPTVSSTAALVDLLSLDDPEPHPATTVASPAVTMSPVSPTKKQPPELLSVLSFGGGATSTSSSYPQPPKSPSFQERNPFPGLALTTPVSGTFPKEQAAERSPSPVTAWPTADTVAKKTEPVDDWDAWNDVDSASTKVSKTAQKVKSPAKAKAPQKVMSAQKTKAPPKASQKPAASTKDASDDWDWEPEESEPPSASEALPATLTTNDKAVQSIPDTAPPPTNVPPPSVLLSIFPSLLALPDKALFQPMAGQPAEVRSRILGDPRTIAFLRNYLQLAAVAARVVAGRKQRWHRDKFLMQSMSISAAGSSNRGGGMKLAGVDKTQGRREDREAADVLAVWKQHVGKLRSALVVANAAIADAAKKEHRHQPSLRLPDLPTSESVSVVTTAKGVVPTAPRPCVICGLRRDERVRGVDTSDGDNNSTVQDSFGEWWVDYWGHRACKNFWAEHEATLRER